MLRYFCPQIKLCRQYGQKPTYFSKTFTGEKSRYIESFAKWVGKWAAGLIKVIEQSGQEHGIYIWPQTRPTTKLSIAHAFNTWAIIDRNEMCPLKLVLSLFVTKEVCYA